MAQSEQDGVHRRFFKAMQELAEHPEFRLTLEGEVISSVGEEEWNKLTDQGRQMLIISYLASKYGLVLEGVNIVSNNEENVC